MGLRAGVDGGGLGGLMEGSERAEGAYLDRMEWRVVPLVVVLLGCPRRGEEWWWWRCEVNSSLVTLTDGAGARLRWCDFLPRGQESGAGVAGVAV